jgi:uncharacterized delta-60 repeat protein
MPRPLPTRRRAAALAGALALLALVGALGAGGAGGAFEGGVAALRADSRVLDVALRRDGKIVVAGEVGRAAGRLRLMVQRLTPAGRPDRGFNRGRPYLGPAGSAANAVALARGGKIVVAGTLTNRAGFNPQGMLAMRLKPNGRPDRGFGGDGRVTALRRNHGEGLAVAVKRNGSVLLAGAATPLDRRDGFHRVALAGFRANGGRDGRFGRRGTAVLDFGRLSRAEDVALARGKIVIAGSVRNNLQSTETLVARLRAGGVPDPGFGRGGVIIRQYARGAAYSAFRSLLMRKGGRVLLAGSAISAAPGPQALVLALKAGAGRDRSFGGDGLVRISASAHPDQYLESSFPGAFGVSATRGGFALAGYYDQLGHQRGAVWALRRNGALKKGFGSSGHLFTDFPARENAIFNTVAARGRRVVTGGERTDVLDDRPQGVLGNYRLP